MRVIGLDLSLTATGIATDTATYTLSSRKLGLTGTARLAWYRDQITIHATHADLAIIEGYAYGAIHKREALGELGGTIRLALWDHQIPYIDIPPKLLKKYATGNGNATKPEMVLAAQRHLGYTGTDHNCADAMWLRAIAIDHYTPGRTPNPTRPERDELLAQITWPERTRP